MKATERRASTGRLLTDGKLSYRPSTSQWHSTGHLISTSLRSTSPPQPFRVPTGSFPFPVLPILLSLLFHFSPCLFPNIPDRLRRSDAQPVIFLTGRPSSVFLPRPQTRKCNLLNPRFHASLVDPGVKPILHHLRNFGYVLQAGPGADERSDVEIKTVIR